MKKIILGIVGVLFLVVGVTLASYPFISNYLMSLNHGSQIVEQENVVAQTGDDVLRQERYNAETYNKNLMGTVIIADPFDPNVVIKTDMEYEQLLNLNDDSIMGSVDIPKINVKMPIFHGTTPEVLLKGAGHLPSTSLPVGGKSTHAVITGHTAVSNAVMFTDLNQLVEGDVFFIHVLGDTLAYQVDQIRVILPTETKYLKIVEHEDHVTLVTCTPYGINTHRLIVRGTRIPYEEAEEIAEQTERVESTWMHEYRKALFIGAIALVTIVVIFIIVRIILSVRRKKRGKY